MWFYKISVIVYWKFIPIANNNHNSYLKKNNAYPTEENSEIIFLDLIYPLFLLPFKTTQKNNPLSFLMYLQLYCNKITLPSFFLSHSIIRFFFSVVIY